MINAVRLPSRSVAPGAVVRIHSGRGRNDRDDLYLRVPDMWNRRDTATPEGMARLLDARVVRQRADYASRINASAPLGKRVQQLAKIRADEGYMAEVKRDGAGFLLIENHCPICAAATMCQGFCASELELFRTALGPGVRVERAEHILSGDRRCVYRIAASR